MEQTFLNALSQGSVAAALVALIAGLLSVATPCVLPMVSITLGILGVNKAASRGRAVLTSLCYAAGIIVTFTGLGIFFGLSGGLFGSYLGHPAVGIALAVIFLVLAANAFELFVIGLPQPLMRLLSRAGGPSYPGAFAAGLGAGFIAAPCIGPVLLGILTFVATTKNAFAGALLLAAYGLGFALPFIIVGAFALRLPVKGALLSGVKSLFGIALMLGSFWYLREALPALRQPRGLAIGLPLVVLGLLLGALHKSFSDPGWRAKVRKSLGVAAAVIGGALLINTAVHRQAAADWCLEKPGKNCLQTTCAENDLTIVVFGASWCPWCEELEKVTLKDARVVARIRDHGKVFVDTDANRSMSRDFSVQGIPTVAFFDRTGRELGRFSGYVDADEFLKILDAVERWHKMQ
jgi:thioredoxin:protein disulfide reductase